MHVKKASLENYEKGNLITGIPDNTFEDLHFAIINAFGFKDNEMASFYLSDTEA